MSEIDQLLNYCYSLPLRHPPVIYRAVNPGRCTPDQSGFCDCSGCVCAAVHHIGRPTPIPCMTSGQLYEWCAHYSTFVPVEFARTNPGYLLFVGFHGNEHVAFSTGLPDPRGQYAAHSPALGLGFAPFSAHNWYAAAAIPGVDYSAHPTPPPVETDVLTLKMLRPDQGLPDGQWSGERPTVMCFEQPGAPLKVGWVIDQLQLDDAHKAGIPLTEVPRDFVRALVLLDGRTNAAT